MRAVVTPAALRGTVRAIASKSQAHRLLICAALADGPTRIICRERSEDIDATAACMRALGADIVWQDGEFRVTPLRTPAPEAVLDCGESGSTLRFLLPVVCALGAGATLRLHGRLPQRPLEPLWSELLAHGAQLAREADGSVRVGGRLAGRDFVIAANVSSQFISGLLFCLPLLGGGSIRLTGTAESVSYLDMTCDALAAFGVPVAWQGDVLTVPPGRYHTPGSLEVEGDWSNAAFWLCASAICGGKLSCTGLNPASSQGDRAVTEAICAIAAGSAVIDAKNIPDLVPVLSVLAALTPGTTRFCNAQRLRLKESDRIAATCAMVQALGGNAEPTEDGLQIVGTKQLPGGTVDSVGDHRIAMSAAVAAVGCTGPVVIEGAQAVRKSYPGFWQDYMALGGQVRLEETP